MQVFPQGSNPLAERVPWWLWPTVLSLDAPLIAVGWQVLLGRVMGVYLHFGHVAVLFLSVGIAYGADRWIDGISARGPATTARHGFARRHPWGIAVALAILLLLDFSIAWTELTERQFRNGLLLTSIVGLYLAALRLPRARWPKEPLVAMIFTGGVCLFVAPRVDPESLVALATFAILFSLLCLGNCWIISEWDSRRSRQPRSLVGVLPRGAFWLPLVFGALAASALAATASPLRLPWPLAGAIAMSSCAQGFLALVQPVGSRRPDLPAIFSDAESWRLLADASLLTPLLFLWRH